MPIEPFAPFDTGDNLDGYSYVGGEKKDFHAAFTVKFGELLYEGYDWGRHRWGMSPVVTPVNYVIHATVRDEVNRLIEMEYWDWEIGDEVGQHGRNMVRCLNRAVEPIARHLSVPLEQIVQGERFDRKERIVDSEYPASQIKTEGSDYATMAKDDEEQRLRVIEGPRILGAIMGYPLLYTLVDAVALCFNPLMYAGGINHNASWFDFHRGATPW